MPKVLKIVLVILGIVGVFVLLLFGGWTLFSRQAFPKTSGKIKVEGLANPVEILRIWRRPYIWGNL